MVVSLLIRGGAVLAVLGLVLAVYVWAARPYQLHWGATAAEVARPMPGDELDASPTFLATRAITIAAPPTIIWPWLAQMGYERAGFYGYDLLENLGSPRGLRSADCILPEFQNFKIGDEVPISAVARLVFHAIEPNRYLIWTGATGQGGFTWALYPLDEQHTRLVSRIRWSHHWQPLGVLVLDLITEFADHLAVRKILPGIKNRVEGRVEPMAQANGELAVYVAAALIFGASLINLLARPLTAWTEWVALAAGLGWLVTWYAPVPAWGGLLLELLVLAGLFRGAP